MVSNRWCPAILPRKRWRKREQTERPSFPTLYVIRPNLHPAPVAVSLSNSGGQTEHSFDTSSMAKAHGAVVESTKIPIWITYIHSGWLLIYLYFYVPRAKSFLCHPNYCIRWDSPSQQHWKMKLYRDPQTYIKCHPDWPLLFGWGFHTPKLFLVIVSPTSSSAIPSPKARPCPATAEVLWLRAWWCDLEEKWLLFCGATIRDRILPKRN